MDKKQELKSIQSMYVLVLKNYPDNQELQLKVRKVSELRLDLLRSLGLLSDQEFENQIVNLKLVAGVKNIFRSFDKIGVKETLNKLSIKL